MLPVRDAVSINAVSMASLPGLNMMLDGRRIPATEKDGQSTLLNICLP